MTRLASNDPGWTWATSRSTVHKSLRARAADLAEHQRARQRAGRPAPSPLRSPCLRRRAPNRLAARREGPLRAIAGNDGAAGMGRPGYMRAAPADGAYVSLCRSACPGRRRRELSNRPRPRGGRPITDQGRTAAACPIARAREVRSESIAVAIPGDGVPQPPSALRVGRGPLLDDIEGGGDVSSARPCPARLTRAAASGGPADAPTPPAYGARGCSKY